MQTRLKRIEEEATQEISQAENLQDLERTKIKYLGRKGVLSEILGSLGTIRPEDRPRIGHLANALKKKLNDLIQSKAALLTEAKKVLPEAGIDITLPGIRPPLGSRHPVTQIIEEICEIFTGLGFRVVEGPEIETDYYNFQALNIPSDHPSRETFHTFYLGYRSRMRDVGRGKDRESRIKDRLLLRSHTSPGQVRIMEKEKPPLAIIIPGKVFRPDAVDASHSFMFHQVEGLMVARGVTFADLKGALSVFAQEMFGDRTRMRFRPHFFPFTEPSAEVDISCVICGGKGCRVCSHKGWLEILGAGMVDPAVFEIVGYDPEEFSGFAFGLGIERIAMLKYGINDIRLFFENDLRFLRQF